MSWKSTTGGIVLAALALTIAVAPLASAQWETAPTSGTSGSGSNVDFVEWEGDVDFDTFLNDGCQYKSVLATGAIANEYVACKGCGSVIASMGDLSCDCAITANDTGTVQVCCDSTTGCPDLPSIPFSIRATREVP